MRYAYKQTVSYGEKGDAELLDIQSFENFNKKPKHILDLGKAWNDFTNKIWYLGFWHQEKIFLEIKSRIF